MSQYKMLVAGELVEGSATLDVINPATAEVFTTVPRANEADVMKAVAAAKSAQKLWKNVAESERRAIVNKIADAIAENAEALAKAITLEQGKVLDFARIEVQFAEDFCRSLASHEFPVKILEETATNRVEEHRNPLGVVAAIIPWNFPLLIAAYKLSPALVTGNAIILKPAPTTPVATLMLGQIIADIVPKGLVSIIVDDNDLGPVLTSHPDIAKISFTGSTPTGKAIMKSAADTMKRLTLELGGNDAAIVLDDADPKTIAPGIFGSAFINSGQVCIALKRLYVHEAVYDELCDEIATLAKNAVVGNGMEKGVQFGPVQNKAQYEKVLSYIEAGKAQGTVIAGGEAPNQPGYVIPLTVIKDLHDGCSLVDEEPFGPVLPIIKYSDLDEVIASANNSKMGLGGSVWSSNLERASKVAAQLETGTVWINQHCAFGPQIHMAPAKESGIGAEWGKEGVKEFTACKVININKA
ncbi:MAG: aldehyde dehydrogenase family protein [Colwellia sp.]|nr:aldehyde dehydrogenase family protein [Colwellia sp.]